MSLRLHPISLREANVYVAKRHRHHGPSQGHKFSIAVRDGRRLAGVVIVGRPVAKAECQKKIIAEVTRLCTDGTANACSILYAAAARACTAMGYRKIRTSILFSESGTSLRAAGWRFSHNTRAQTWDRVKRNRKRVLHLECKKQVWVKDLA